MAVAWAVLVVGAISIFVAKYNWDSHKNLERKSAQTQTQTMPLDQLRESVLRNGARNATCEQLELIRDYDLQLDMGFPNSTGQSHQGEMVTLELIRLEKGCAGIEKKDQYNTDPKF